jgi:hypothetical protein
LHKNKHDPKTRIIRRWITENAERLFPRDAEFVSQMFQAHEFAYRFGVVSVLVGKHHVRDIYSLRHAIGITYDIILDFKRAMILHILNLVHTVAVENERALAQFKAGIEEVLYEN